MMDGAAAPTWEEAPPTIVDPLPGRQSTPEPCEELAAIAVERFGDYWLLAKLGHGGMGEVFVAEPVGSTQRDLCVVKRIHAGLQIDPGYVDMFYDEGRVARYLDHPCLVKTYALGEAEGSPYIAMEYLQGQPLSRINARARDWWGRLPVEVVVRTACDVLAGLDHAHGACDEHGQPLHIVHRDVTPGNVFVTYDGQVKLLDFGIARATSRRTHTQSGQIKGKFAYVAPEYVRGPELDRRADVWTVGVLLWEAIAGRRLFHATNSADTLRAVLKQPIPLLHDEADAPRQLDRILEGALQRDPGRRYATAADFRHDLEDFLARFAPFYGSDELGAQLRQWFEPEMRRDAYVLQEALEQLGDPATRGPAGPAAPGPLDGATEEPPVDIELEDPAAGESDAAGADLDPGKCEQKHGSPRVLWMLFAALAATVLAGAMTAL